MPSYNKIIMVGHVTRDPQNKVLPNGTVVCDCGLAVNHKWKDREEVCFIDFTAFGRQAELIGEHVRKGDPLLIDGRLKYDTWEDKSGGKRSKHTVVIDNFQFMGGKRDAEPEAEQPPARSAAPAGRSRQPARTGRGPDGPTSPIPDEGGFLSADCPF